MGRKKGSLNKAKENFQNIEQKALPPNFGDIRSLVIAPRPISNDAPSLLRLNTGWVSICIQKIASTLISLPLKMYVVKDDVNKKCIWKTKQLSRAHQSLIKKNTNNLKIKQASDIELVEEHIIWEVLNNVNSDLNWNDMVKMITQYLLLLGNAYIGIKNKKGIPYGLEVLPAEYTNVMLNVDDMEIEKYRVYNGIKEAIWEKEDCLHLKRVSAGMFWRLQTGKLVTGTYGMGALEEILSPVMLMNAIDDYERALMENQAVPAGIINYKDGTLTPAQIKDAEASWKKALGGLKRAGTIKVTDQNWDFTPLQLNPKDLSYQSGRKWLREVISNAFGVPVGMLSPTESNRATSLTDMANYFSFTIAPLCSLITDKLNHSLVPHFDDNLYLEFENPNKTDNEFKLKEMETQLKMGVITVNEVRAEMGLDPVAWGDSFGGSNGVNMQNEQQQPNQNNQNNQPSIDELDKLDKLDSINITPEENL